MSSIGALILQLNFGLRDDGPGNPWFWIIGSAELNFKNLIQLSDINQYFRLFLKDYIRQNYYKIHFRESVRPMPIEYNSYIENNPFTDIKYFAIGIDDFFEGVIDYTLLTGVHSVSLSDRLELIDILDLKRVHNLYLDSIRLKNMISIEGVYKLKLVKIDQPIDLSVLNSVHTLHLQWLRNWSNLKDAGNVHTLSLNDVDNVSDVSALKNVHILQLEMLSMIADVSALKGVHTIKLYRLPSVTDVSALGGVHTLKLYHLPSVVDVSALGDVHTLKLYHLPSVVDVSALGDVDTLKLYHLPSVADVSALGGVSRLYLDNHLSMLL
jgi:hypothetical protein